MVRMVLKVFSVDVLYLELIPPAGIEYPVCRHDQATYLDRVCSAGVFTVL